MGRSASKNGRMRTMRKVGGTVVACAVVLCATGTAQAGGLSLAGRAGTPGFGLEASKSVTPRFNLRAGLGLLSRDSDLDASLSSRSVETNVHFDGQIKLKAVSLLADLYASDSFHVTGGLVYNRNKINLDARTTSPVEVNDQVYTPDQLGTLTGTVTLGKKWAPYAGIGFGNPTSSNRRVTFLFDLGVVFEGQPTVTMTSSRANDAGLQADVAAAAEEINRDHFDKSYLKFYPVISIGLAVRVF
jgi:hypothetical protein